ncbi:MAG: adenylate/guanylate cyclase domain-containing protein, partial [Pseudomonadota bacterium]
QQGLDGASQSEVLSGYCTLLVDLGVPLLRVHVTHQAFHPSYGGIGFDWERASGTSFDRYARTANPPDVWLRSPLLHMLASQQYEFRERLTGTSTFPILNDLHARGVTDYYARALLFEKRDGDLPIDLDASPHGALLSWSCDGPDGFAPEHLALIDFSLPSLGLALKSAANRDMARDLLGVYLGRDAGHRVLSGEIQRGSLQTLNAAVCYFDLVGFTGLAEEIGGPAVIEMLNAYLDVAVDVVESADGHVLKFMGDGFLAMFDVGDDRADAEVALDSAQRLSERIDSLNQARTAAGLPCTGFTLAVHNGEILYGNIGGENRLDFTVIGPTVNLAARISDMHKSIGQKILITEPVRLAAHPDRTDLVSVGRYMLRGVPMPMELFTLYALKA